MSLEIRRLSYALGAEILGVNLADRIDEELFTEIHRAFLDHQLLLFRDQDITRAQHIAFSRRFGSPYDRTAKAIAYVEPPKEYPELSMVIHQPEPADSSPKLPVGGQWHSDRADIPEAAAASILRCVEVPDVGGDTMFANMYAAYDALSEPMKHILEPLHGVYMDPPLGDYAKNQDGWREVSPAATQPAVRVHAETGRKMLYVSTETLHFVGMTAEESQPIIKFLTRQAVRPENVYRHHWHKNDVVVWDNRCLLHIALGDYDKTKYRHMERVVLKGDRSGEIYDGPVQMPRHTTWPAVTHVA